MLDPKNFVIDTFFILGKIKEKLEDKMKDFLMDVMNAIEMKNVDYGDVRIVYQKTQSVNLRNGEPQGIADIWELGYGVRVLKNGRWGFASRSDLNKEEITKVVDEAVKLAEESSTVGGEPVILAPEDTYTGEYKSNIKIDPFTIPIKDKINLLLEADRNLSKVKGVLVRNVGIEIRRIEKYFASTEGTNVHQVIFLTGGEVKAMAPGANEIQVRTYPYAGGVIMQKGWEYIQEIDLSGNAERVGEEAVMLLSAEQCPSGIYDIILAPDQLYLQIHESIGHALELDRVFGSEVSYAGASFATTEKLGKFRYGSEIVNIVADSTFEGGPGTFGWDDEGVKAHREYLIKDGILVGYLSSRETAQKLGRRSSGAMRASSYNRIPLVRMVNVNLLPGEWKLEDLIADTDRGILMETNRSWSIDDFRVNFQFGTEIGYLIENGKITRTLKNCTYTGITPEFWNSCDAICGEEEYRMIGVPNCGKGEPGQIMYLGHASSHARFRNVRVGIR